MSREWPALNLLITFDGTWDSSWQVVPGAVVALHPEWGRTAGACGCQKKGCWEELDAQSLEKKVLEIWVNTPVNSH